MRVSQKIAQKRRVLKKNQLTVVQKYGWKIVISLILLGLVIGSTYTFIYEELKTSKVVVVNIADAQTDSMSQDMGAVVSTASHLDSNQSNDININGSEREITSTSPESLIKKYFPDNYEMMIKIAMWESSMNPNAVNINRNGTKDVGYFQINSIHGYDESYLKVPENNVKVAREIYDKQGYQAWASYNYRLNHGLLTTE